MKSQLTLAVFLAASLGLTACAKKESAPVAEAESSAAATTEEQVSAEQQAAIDAIDKPVLDEKNTDIPAHLSNQLADDATARTSVAASSDAVAP